VMIAGVIRRFEIWDSERFAARLSGAKTNFQDNLSKLAAKGVRIRL
jgi:DNA-binding transcriptional regulator/RsmH inhibitor MraZ